MRPLLLMLAGLIVSVRRAEAQTPAPLRLSFAEAVRRAAGEAPVVALATLRTSEAEARVRQTRATLLPGLSVGAERRGRARAPRDGHGTGSRTYLRRGPLYACPCREPGRKD